jgi:hypothetical protein
LEVFDPSQVLYDVLAIGIPHVDAVSKTRAIVYRHFFLPQSSSAVSPLLHPTTFRGPRLGLIRCVGQALATEAIAECIRGGGICEAESNIELLGLVSTPTAADRDASFLVERIKL